MADQKAEEYLKHNAPVDASAYATNFGAHREGMTKEEVADYYSNWALKGTYEQDLGPDRYHGPEIACDAMEQTYEMEDRGRVKVLDIAAGTGFLGEKLFKKGFTKIDALDPAEGMLAVARKKNVYGRLICDFMGENRLPVENDEYDCAVIAGGMGEGHIPCVALHEMIRIVKPGGKIIIVMRQEYLEYVGDYKDALEPLMQQLEADGKWDLISRTVVPNYSFNKNGVVFKFQHNAPVDASAYATNFGAHREGMTKEEVADYYSNWALKGTYEQDVGPDRYHGPEIACDAMEQTYEMEDRGRVKVLDIAAGTGFLGEKLFKKGFTKIDALDPAEGMLAVARKKNVYGRLICDFMGENRLPVENDEYDCAVIAGGMGEGHIPCVALYEMIRIVKPGGKIIIVMRQEYLEYVGDYKDALEPLMKQLEADGKWDLISRTVVPNYSFNKNGVVFKFQ
ncbi:hypothetical protein KUTeg_004884, partial [Tegillarca granosa]